MQFTSLIFIETEIILSIRLTPNYTMPLYTISTIAKIVNGVLTYNNKEDSIIKELADSRKIQLNPMYCFALVSSKMTDTNT